MNDYHKKFSFKNNKIKVFFNFLIITLNSIKILHICSSCPRESCKKKKKFEYFLYIPMDKSSVEHPVYIVYAITTDTNDYIGASFCFRIKRFVCNCFNCELIPTVQNKSVRLHKNITVPYNYCLKVNYKIKSFFAYHV